MLQSLLLSSRWWHRIPSHHLKSPLPFATWPWGGSKVVPAVLCVLPVVRIVIRHACRCSVQTVETKSSGDAQAVRGRD